MPNKDQRLGFDPLSWMNETDNNHQKQEKANASSSPADAEIESKLIKDSNTQIKENNAKPVFDVEEKTMTVNKSLAGNSTSIENAETAMHQEMIRTNQHKN
jgi:hypothetical protein